MIELIECECCGESYKIHDPINHECKERANVDNKMMPTSSEIIMSITKPKRKIIQISVIINAEYNEGYPVVHDLTDDGNVYFQDIHDEWIKVKDIPQDSEVGK